MSPSRAPGRVRSPLVAVVPVLAWIVGCGASPPTGVVASDRPAAPSAAEAVVAPPATSARPPTLEAELASRRSARVEAALAHIPSVTKLVSEIRGLPLRHPVPAAEQSQDEFRHFLQGEIKKEMPPEKSAAAVRALVRLGFLKASIDLGKTVEDAMLSQAGAYYDPRTKKFFLVLVPDDATMLDVMSAHELTHAIDDEYFDLAAYTDDPNHELSNDAQQARRMVDEGDATLVMLAYETRVAAHKDIFALENRRLEQAMVATFATLDSAELARSAVDNPGLASQMGPGMKASIDAMSTIPAYILDPLFGAYTKGAAAIAAVRDAGGWDAVAKLYTSPPESTEQLLHPMEKLIGTREHPVVLQLAPPPALFSGLTPLDTDVFGELTMAVYFKNWGDKTPAAEVTGWGGDRYAAFDVGGHVVGAWMTTWDAPSDATRFANAYRASLASRFPGEPTLSVASAAGAVGVSHPDGTVTVLSHAPRGKDVAIVDGAPAASVGAVLTWLGQTRRTQAK